MFKNFISLKFVLKTIQDRNSLCTT